MWPISLSSSSKAPPWSSSPSPVRMVRRRSWATVPAGATPSSTNCAQPVETAVCACTPPSRPTKTCTPSLHSARARRNNATASGLSGSTRSAPARRSAAVALRPSSAGMRMVGPKSRAPTIRSGSRSRSATRVRAMRADPQPGHQRQRQHQPRTQPDGPPPSISAGQTVRISASVRVRLREVIRCRPSTGRFAAVAACMAGHPQPGRERVPCRPAARLRRAAARAAPPG